MISIDSQSENEARGQQVIELRVEEREKVSKPKRQVNKQSSIMEIYNLIGPNDGESANQPENYKKENFKNNPNELELVSDHSSQQKPQFVFD